MGRRYDFTVNEKKYPYVSYIIDELIKGAANSKLSSIVCIALQEHFLRNGLLVRRLAYERIRGKVPIDQLRLVFESLLPSIAEPLSMFDYDQNKEMYYQMTDDLLAHSELVGQHLVDGVGKRRKAMKEYAKVWLANTEEEEKEEEEEWLLEYITMLAYRQQRSAKERREERIKELQEELRRLTKEETYENNQEVQRKETKNNEVAHEISKP